MTTHGISWPREKLKYHQVRLVMLIEESPPPCKTVMCLRCLTGASPYSLGKAITVAATVTSLYSLKHQGAEN